MKLSGPEKSRQVNSLLHTLRGEQYRHLQNVRSSRERVAPPRTYNTPTLPVRLTALAYDSEISNEQPVIPIATSPVTYSGPAPPKSWKLSSPQGARVNIEWHMRALSVASAHMGSFADLPHVPTLSLLCLQIVVSKCSSKDDFKDNVVPYIPPHLRRDIIRYCAVHCPLPNWKLDALFSPYGNADGEILVMGPTANLSEEYFSRRVDMHEDSEVPQLLQKRISHISSDWDNEETLEIPLNSLLLVSTHLHRTTFFSFPPTITHLVLIDLPSPIPIHRLPKLCPLIILLDLSYNHWLKIATSEEMNSLLKTPWDRWKSLEVVGLRDCCVPDALLRNINTRRWDDVQVITT